LASACIVPASDCVLSVRNTRWKVRKRVRLGICCLPGQNVPRLLFDGSGGIITQKTRGLFPILLGIQLIRGLPRSQKFIFHVLYNYSVNGSQIIYFIRVCFQII